MEIGLLQYSPVWENKKESREKITAMLNKTSRKPELLIMPEMTLTGFTMHAVKNAEKRDGESFRFFSELAAENNMHIIAGIIEEDEGLIYNTLLHVGNEGMLVVAYRKIHPFSYSGENKYFSRGEKQVMTLINDWKTGLSVCYDLRFPELYRVYGKERCGLIINIASWPAARIDHWRALLKARAIENQCYVAAVNRTGSDPKLKYTGCSSIYDPAGNEIAFLEKEESIITVNIDIKKVDETRKKFPFLEDIYLI